MKASKLLLGGLALVALAGCCSTTNVALLERQLRVQEDEIYRLRDCVEDYEDELNSCRRQNAGPPKRGIEEVPTTVVSPRTGPGPRTEAVPRTDVGPQLQPPPSVEVPTGPESEAPGMPTPRGRPSTSPAPLPLRPPTNPQRGPAPLKLPGPEARQMPEDGPSLSARKPSVSRVGVSTAKAAETPVIAGDSRQVKDLVINKQATGGYAGKGGTGDEGVQVVLEPRDAQGRIIAAPADLSIVVIDPALEGDAGRIARWDLSATDAAPLFQAAEMKGGLQIELPWPSEPPKHADLRLFARYTTSDGRRLQAEQPIRVDLTGAGGKTTQSGAVPDDAGQMPSGRTAKTWQPSANGEGPAEDPLQGRVSDDDDSPRTADADDSPGRSARSPARRGEPSLKRPRWSPNRP